ncbi:MarR family transcriptional regulator [Pandoraea captiosa]|uniref:MarR family transcriptional regulator n=1 Tax=Pandoraea captiosa TaxID=2508302 RepID=A0A5E4ZLV3_9BURK|nr:MarR family transcriptional regulator [Pandoraea captiosa]VVE62144.1 MarR family transcriptional regulator [Pandoraea captiosa]
MTRKTQPAAAPLPLTDFLCFAIYSTNLAFGKAYKPILQALGLTYTQYIVIIALWEEDHQTVSSLGEKLFLESNTLTPMLKKLEAMGYVSRARNTADERQVVLSLTDEGRKLREKAFSADLTDACGLSANEFQHIRESIVALRTNLLKHVAEHE